MKRHQRASVFLKRVSQTRKNLEGSVTRNSTETVESSGLAFALGRASGLELAEGLVWGRGKWLRAVALLLCHQQRSVSTSRRRGGSSSRRGRRVYRRPTGRVSPGHWAVQELKVLGGLPTLPGHRAPTTKHKGGPPSLLLVGKTLLKN